MVSNDALLLQIIPTQGVVSSEGTMGLWNIFCLVCRFFTQVKKQIFLWSFEDTHRMDTPSFYGYTAYIVSVSSIKIWPWVFSGSLKKLKKVSKNFRVERDMGGILAKIERGTLLTCVEFSVTKSLYTLPLLMHPTLFGLVCLYFKGWGWYLM